MPTLLVYDACRPPAVTLGFSVHRPGAPQTLVCEQVVIDMVACLHVLHVDAYGVMHSAYGHDLEQ